LASKGVFKINSEKGKRMSAIYIPETAKEKSRTGPEFKLNGQDCLRMECSDVLARMLE
jgi:co-chaperonin GroES (HSP10)